MPLQPGSSKEVIHNNIQELMKTHKYPIKQAVAIAYRNAQIHKRLNKDKK